MSMPTLLWVEEPLREAIEFGVEELLTEPQPSTERPFNPAEILWSVRFGKKDSAHWTP